MPNPSAAVVHQPRVAHFDGAAVLADSGRWARAYERVHAADLGLIDHGDPPITERLPRHATRPGFGLAGALGGAGEVAGFLYGYALPEDSLWWEGLTPDPGPEFTREHPGRTVGICEILVAAEWRRSRIAHTLFGAFVAGRAEERAAGLVAADNAPMLAGTRSTASRPSGGWSRIPAGGPM
ncbi:hypothetical protein ACIOEX_06460 [Streptomyces sp. NPDC087850]|uniref:hypothetical protein n=1 Tax=Streptomyces sp. NPDC087850 TaxID=3365809 RepID=UPI00380C1F32